MLLQNELLHATHKKDVIMHSTVVWLAIQVVVIACISVGVHAVVWLALTIHCSGLAYNTSLQWSGLQY